VSSFRIALAQIAPRLGDIRGNVESHLKLVDEARGAGVDVLLFPELSLVGNALGDLADDLALDLDASEFGEIRRASREIAIGIGLIERGLDRASRNAYLYLEGGTVRHVQRKVHLATDDRRGEARVLAAGDRIAAFETRRGRFGILIGDDARHLPAAAILALERVDAIVAPTSVVDRPAAMRSPADAFVATTGALAELSRCHLFAVNRTGSEEGEIYAGRSRIVGPDGTILGAADGAEEGLVHGELDYELLRSARRSAPGPRDLRRDVILAQMRRIEETGR